MPMQLTVDANFKPRCPRHTFRHRFWLTVTESIGKVNKQKWAQNRKGFAKVRGGGSGGKWKWFGICINYQLQLEGEMYKLKQRSDRFTVSLPSFCSRLPWRTRSLNKMSPTLLQFVAIFASNLQIQSTPSTFFPIPSSLLLLLALCCCSFNRCCILGEGLLQMAREIAAQ